MNLNQLLSALRMSQDDLAHLSIAYADHKIRKRSGGTRRLLIPNDELERLQKYILRHILYRLPAHPCATGFRCGISIADNALLHVNQAAILRMDVKDFFTSTSADRIYEWFSNSGWSQEASNHIVRICTAEGGLPQGSPTSPCLSNIVNSKLDARLQGLGDHYKAIYSRYADDLTFILEKIPSWRSCRHQALRENYSKRVWIYYSRRARPR